jgi:hypothetical protein
MAHGWLLYNLVQGHNADLKREMRNSSRATDAKRISRLQSVRKKLSS